MIGTPAKRALDRIVQVGEGVIRQDGDSAGGAVAAQLRLQDVDLIWYVVGYRATDLA